VTDPEVLTQLRTLNRLDEIVLSEETVTDDITDPDVSEEDRRTSDPAKIAVTTRSGTMLGSQETHPDDVASVRRARIRTAQDEEAWIRNLKLFVQGQIDLLSSEEAKRCAKQADGFEVDVEGLLCYRSEGRRNEDGSRDVTMRIVVPTTLQSDLLHHYHVGLEGGHQGIGRTYARLRRHFYWRSMYKDVQRYVNECVDCETGKGTPGIRGVSPGNLRAVYPFQAIAMDHIPSLPESYRGNTELLIWVDLFSGYVIAKANGNRTAEAVAEAYEECVFRRFGASEFIRHDREPGFMSSFFGAFNRLIGQRQRATLAYRPQANGSAERMVQTLTRAVKMYVEDEGQRDWDDYAERIVLALNTAHDRVRDETPFYLIHGWDPKTTVEAALAVGSEQAQDRIPRRWRYQIQRQYSYGRKAVAALLEEAQRERAETANARASEHHIRAGSQVWLYLDKVREGFSHKLAHKWHGPFRVSEMVNEFTCRLETRGSGYQVFPLVHVSKLKLYREHQTRPTAVLADGVTIRADFDEALLPEDSFMPDPQQGVYEVEDILDRRVVPPRTRNGRHKVEYLVRWRGYTDPDWVAEADLNCGGLLFDFQQQQKARNRFQVMQTAPDGAPA
jgi:hypothetical protein